MSYRVKRIDPYWIKSPILPVIAIAGAAAALVLIEKFMVVPAITAAVVGALAVVLATQPAISAALGVLGMAGGIWTFIVHPDAQNASLALWLRLVSTLMFSLFYTVLMDGMVLLVSALYNLFAGAIGLGGLSFDLENDADAAADEA